ncbi:MAG: aspartate carbamoyltransferase regulatory subunit [Candidatus Methanofastidiosia archaeon]
MKKRELKVSAINNGTVIDHIRPGNAFKVVKILHLDNYKDTITITSNVPSGVTGRKDIVKVENRALSPEEVSSIALVSPEATVNIIKDYEVIEKGNISLPETIYNIIACTNPLCVTNHEDVPTVFNVEGTCPLVLRCQYCERKMTEKEIIKVMS